MQCYADLDVYFCSGSKRGHKLKSSTAETQVPQVSIAATTLLDKSKTDRKITLEDIKGKG